MIETKHTLAQECFRPIPKRDRVILVEGLDDGLLVEAICREEGLARAIQILCYSQGGKLGDFLNLLVRNANFGIVKHVGLTRDADNGKDEALKSLESAWERASKVLTSLGMDLPLCSFFALPDNQTTGRLENLCLLSPSFPQILKCAQEMYDCALAVATYGIDREKAIVAAYLSMMERGRLQLGTGAQAGSWNLRSEAFGPLRQFLVALGT